jgi:tRNA A-37 threonylcarbamoyl transferase component Bud32
MRQRLASQLAPLLLAAALLAAAVAAPAPAGALLRQKSAGPGATPQSVLPEALADCAAALRRGDPGAALALLRAELAARASAVHAQARAVAQDPPESWARALGEAVASGELTLALGLLGALCGALAVLRVLRTPGDLVVCLEYPAELRGTFSVLVARSAVQAHARRRRATRVTNPAAADRSRHRASRTEHPLVSRETEFRDLAPRRYWLVVEGFLQPAGSEEVVSSLCMERDVRVPRGQTVRVVLDLRPAELPVDLRILWDRRPVSEAQVALRGVQSAPRVARAGTLRLRLAPGPHTLVVGSGDRVAERRVEVDAFRGTSLELDLGARENLLFAGCPPAVEPFLLGNVPEAARLLECDGQAPVAHQLLARFHEEREQPEAAAEHFEAAGDLLRAAELYQVLGQATRAGELFERAGELARAAQSYRGAGELSRAGEAFERAELFEDAVTCFREAGDLAGWVRALERAGEPFEAARVAREGGDARLAIRSLQQVPYDDARWTEAALGLVEIYEANGHADLAVHKAEEILQTKGEEAVPLPVCDRLSRRLEEQDDVERALAFLEVIRRRDVAWPDLATRIEALRKRHSELRGTQSPGASAALAATQAFGAGFRYEILEEIGRGGMGIVFRARDRHLGREVALKRLPENLRTLPSAVKLFLREARAAASLNHPNIVTVHDAGQEGDSYFITMELLAGSPLHKVLHQSGRLTARSTAQLGLQAANGLHYAHGQRIVHRDVKTANLFFTSARSLKIMDFGIAKTLEEVRRSSTLIGGTPYYMAPEQSLGDAVDGRADLYALGATLFELLTGRVPFAEGDVTLHHRHTPPPDPRDLCDAVPDALAELILSLLAKSPDDRPAHAGLVAESLQAVIRALG